MHTSSSKHLLAILTLTAGLWGCAAQPTSQTEPEAGREPEFPAVVQQAQSPATQKPPVTSSSRASVAAKPPTAKLPRSTEPPVSKPAIIAAPATKVNQDNALVGPMEDVESPAKPEQAAVVVPVKFQLEQLPLVIADQWRLSSETDRCILSSLEYSMDDGQGDTKVVLQLTPNNWTLYTESDIDLSYNNTGLTVDAKVHFALERVVKDSNVVFENDRSRIIDAFINAQQVQIALGFWPTWPVTETKTVIMAIDHFEVAYRTWKDCQQRVNAR